MASPTREFTSTSLAFGSLLVKYNLDIWNTYYYCSCSLSHVSRGLERGTALPLLLDLDSKPVFLHDNSVPSLDALFDSNRGADAPHPFYLSDTAQRTDVVTFLRSLGTN